MSGVTRFIQATITRIAAERRAQGLLEDEERERKREFHASARSLHDCTSVYDRQHVVPGVLGPHDETHAESSLANDIRHHHTRPGFEGRMTKRLLVVGSINLDLVVVAAKIPHAGETISGMSFNTFPGGKGANQAYAAARLGTPVSMIGKLGNDAFGVELRGNLESAGVDTSAVEVVPTSSGIAQITTAANGENVIVVVAGANGHLSPADLDRHVDVICNSSIILAQLEIPLETVVHLASLAGRERIPLVLDPAPAQPLPSSLLRSVEWLTPNESEAGALLGLSAKELTEDKLEESAELLLGHGCRNVILKLGHRGCYLALANGTRALVPGYKVKAVDTTAAGDAFNGAFASSIMQGNDPVGSARWACAVAAVSVTRHGAQPSMPTRAEVQGFLDSRQEVETTDLLTGR